MLEHDYSPQQLVVQYPHLHILNFFFFFFFFFFFYLFFFVSGCGLVKYPGLNKKNVNSRGTKPFRNCSCHYWWFRRITGNVIAACVRIRAIWSGPTLFRDVLVAKYFMNYNECCYQKFWMASAYTNRSHLCVLITYLFWCDMRVRLVPRRMRVRHPPGRHHSIVEIDYEIFSTVTVFLPLIQEWQLSVSGERMCTILVNRLED